MFSGDDYQRVDLVIQNSIVKRLTKKIKGTRDRLSFRRLEVVELLNVAVYQKVNKQLEIAPNKQFSESKQKNIASTTNH